MISLGVKNMDNKEAVATVYGVAVTKAINSFATLSFSINATGNNLVAVNMLGPGTIFTAPDGQKYQYTTGNPVPSVDYQVYSVTATHVGVQLGDNFVKDTLNGSQSIQACLDLMVQGTPFKYQVDGNFNAHDFSDAAIGNASAADMLAAIAEAWSCQYYFDNYTLHIAKTIGKDNAFLFVDRVNTSHISWTESYDSFATAIHGYGKPVEQVTSDSDNTPSNQSTTNDFVAYARSFVGHVPYIWGGNTPSGWDCSGFVAYVYNHFGVAMHQPTTYEEYQGTVIGPPYQTGDMLFWGARGATYHVALALDSNTLVMAANEQRGTVQQSINAWRPDFGVRNSAMVAKLAAANTTSSKTVTPSDLPAQYTCEADYISPLADKPGIGKRWAAPYYSTSITDVEELKQALKGQLHDYPDVQYTVDWVSFTKNAGGFVNSINIGNQGWLKDRYGTDIKVKIQSYTRYLDEADPVNRSTITFGNKIFDSSIWDTRTQRLAEAQSIIRQEIQRMSVRQNAVRSDNVPILTEKEVTDLEQYVRSNGQFRQEN